MDLDGRDEAVVLRRRGSSWYAVIIGGSGYGARLAVAGATSARTFPELDNHRRPSLDMRFGYRTLSGDYPSTGPSQRAERWAESNEC